MKKFLTLALALVMIVSTLCLGSCTNANKTKFTVGICQLVTHDALDAATKGFKDALVAALGEENVEFIEQNAAGSSDTCAQIMSTFVNKNVDLIMANATPALQAAAAATCTIPVLGTSVTEYGVALGINNFNGTVGDNISGTSDLASIADQAAMILDLFPNTSNVSVLYCSAEANSQYQFECLKSELQKNKPNVNVTAFKFSDSNDVITVTNSAVATCDLLYIPTDNTAASCIEAIAGVVNETNIPVFCGEEGCAKPVGVATLTISYYDLGVKTGEMAAKILKGEEKIENMAIAYAPATKKYNKTFADKFSLTQTLIDKGYVEMK